MGHGITVVGSLNADLVVSVRRFPTPGETVTGQGFAVFSGGKGANQAFGAARLAMGQLPVRMVGRVGNDAYGGWLRQNLAGAGVDVGHVVPLPESPTGLALIAIDPSGQNQIVVVPGANGDFAPAALSERLSAYAYPRRIEFVADLPKTLTGKIRRIELRQLELERAGALRG